MITDQTPPRRYVFTLHLWQEALDVDQFEWRGQVKHVASGDLRYFRDAKTLYDVLETMIAEQIQDSNPAANS